MKTNTLRCASILLLMATGAFSQSSSVIIATGYSAPAPVQVAPGQIVTLFARGIGPSPNGELRSAQSTVAPTLLAGLSAQVIQSQFLFNVPIFAVHQENECGNPGVPSPSCLLTSIKVQVPFEITAAVSQKNPAGPLSFSPVAQLILYVDNQASRSFLVQPVPDNAHVLTTCDAEWDTRASSVCDRQVFHLDGRVVSETASASAGETLSITLFGLGQTSPPAATGAFALPGMFLTEVLGYPRVAVALKSLVNAPGSIPRHGHNPDPSEVGVAITGAGLVAAKIGTYQLNVALPDSLQPVVPCGNGVHSNYVMNVITSQGAEQVAVCVQP